MTIAGLGNARAYIDMELREAVEADAPEWDAFVDSQRTVPPLCHFAWRGVLTREFGAEPHFVIVRNGEGAVCGVLPAYIVPGRRRCLYTLHRGFLADTPSAVEAMLSFLEALRYSEHLDSIQFSSPTEIGLADRAIVKESLVLPLAKTEVETWDGLRAKTRNMIRKAEKLELCSERGSQNLRAFYELYAGHLLRKGIPVHSYSLFEMINQEIGPEGELIVARKSGEIIAGIYVFFGSSRAVYPFQATRADCQHLAATQFLIWEASKRAIARGVSWLDMGESRAGSPVYQSKVNFGGVPEAIYYYNLSNSGSPAPSAMRGVTFGEIGDRLVGLVHRGMMNHAPLSVRGRYGGWHRRKGRLLF